MKKTLLILALPLLLAGCFDYSDGERAGTITKMSRKGIFCKTWEGQINLSGMKNVTVSSSDGKSTMDETVPNTFDFTVEQDHANLVPIIQDALNNGKRIKVTYRQELITFCRSDSDDYFVTAVSVQP